MKRILVKKQQKYIRKILLIARPCEEDSSKNRSTGWRSSLTLYLSARTRYF